jgi:hypothetical protein
MRRMASAACRGVRDPVRLLPRSPGRRRQPGPRRARRSTTPSGNTAATATRSATRSSIPATARCRPSASACATSTSARSPSTSTVSAAGNSPPPATPRVRSGQERASSSGSSVTLSCSFGIGPGDHRRQRLAREVGRDDAASPPGCRSCPPGRASSRDARACSPCQTLALDRRGCRSRSRGSRAGATLPRVPGRDHRDMHADPGGAPSRRRCPSVVEALLARIGRAGPNVTTCRLHHRDHEPPPSHGAAPSNGNIAREIGRRRVSRFGAASPRASAGPGTMPRPRPAARAAAEGRRRPSSFRQRRRSAPRAACEYALHAVSSCEGRPLAGGALHRRKRGMPKRA